MMNRFNFRVANVSSIDNSSGSSTDNLIMISPNSLWGNHGTDETFYIFMWGGSNSMSWLGVEMSFDSSLNYWVYDPVANGYDIGSDVNLIIARYSVGNLTSPLNQSEDLALSLIIGHKCLINDKDRTGVASYEYED